MITSKGDDKGNADSKDSNNNVADLKAKFVANSQNGNFTVYINPSDVLLDVTHSYDGSYYEVPFDVVNTNNLGNSNGSDDLKDLSTIAFKNQDGKTLRSLSLC